jgi:hypothetical protein
VLPILQNTAAFVASSDPWPVSDVHSPEMELTLRFHQNFILDFHALKELSSSRRAAIESLFRISDWSGKERAARSHFHQPKISVTVHV